MISFSIEAFLFFIICLTNIHGSGIVVFVTISVIWVNEGADIKDYRNFGFHQRILPKVDFQKENNYMIQKRKMETTKNGNTVKLVLPFPYVLWMLGMNPDSQKEEIVLHEPQTEQGNINRESVNYGEEK